MRALSTHSRKERRVKTVPGEFDERVGVASLPRPIVFASRTARKRIERRADDRPTHRIEVSLEEDGTTFAGAHFESAGLNILQLFGLKCLSVVCMARVCAIRPETAEIVTHRLIEERLFLECGGGR